MFRAPFLYKLIRVRNGFDMIELPLIVFGMGGVGRSLLRQIVQHRTLHAQQYGLALDIHALCDSQGAAISVGKGIDDVILDDLLELKETGGQLADHTLGGAYGHSDLGDLVDIVRATGRKGAVIVDCTATDDTTEALLFARQQGFKLVLANKKPLTSSMEVYNRLTRAGLTGDEFRSLAVCRWETTVGAGLPAIATQNRLVASGDSIHAVAGTFSGTLGYVMTGLQEGRPFSEIVREAHSLGYTEPDPRDDLGGIDVARKALILARGMGWELGMDDVAVTGLYPPEMQTLSVSDFLEALPSLDADFAERVSSAAVEGSVLRYAANVNAGRCVVGPTVVTSDSPLGRLSGTDNLVEFHSEWYNPNPLVIQGRGAGVDATAAGILSDVVELAYTN